MPSRQRQSTAVFEVQGAAVLVRVPKYLEVPPLSSFRAGGDIPRAAALERAPQRLEMPSRSSELADVAVLRAAELVRVLQHLEVPPKAAILQTLSPMGSRESGATSALGAPPEQQHGAPMV
eukprot:CAMPEP_0180026114 /NCGR_PEP_ID=MMETSP0984-20121128/25015_1 /TAXON_ID=483367 /ORGANISM="non described non described, Strain CCMP 2436" /LENGTH=120 /DNA_ID=CAMNT_0021950789 /DNA_START=191 /DNA_END=554 /DNA_ORIENTATION=-